jgi:hypothetical protein
MGKIIIYNVILEFRLLNFDTFYLIDLGLFFVAVLNESLLLLDRHFNFKTVLILNKISFSLSLVQFHHHLRNY